MMEEEVKVYINQPGKGFIPTMVESAVTRLSELPMYSDEHFKELPPVPEMDTSVVTKTKCKEEIPPPEEKMVEPEETYNKIKTIKTESKAMVAVAVPLNMTKENAGDIYSVLPTPTQQKITHFGSRSGRWTPETMCEALDSVFSGSMLPRIAAKHYGIPSSTFSDRLTMNNVKERHLIMPGSYPLNPQSDAEIVDFVKNNCHTPRSTLLQGIIWLAEDMALKNGYPFKDSLSSRKWLKIFAIKHPELDILAFPPVPGSGLSPSLTLQSLGHLSDTLSPRFSQHSSPGSHPNTPSKRKHTGSPQYQPESPGLTACLPPTNSHTFRGKDPVRNWSIAQQKEDFKPTSEEINSMELRIPSSDAIDRSYEFWKLCREHFEYCADEKDLAAVLYEEAFGAVEQVLDKTLLNSFRHRYENPGSD